MVDKEKLIIMTKLAIYDKNFGELDKSHNEYYRSDYVYKKNMWTRLFAFFGAAIILVMHYFYQIAIEEIEIFSIDIRQELTDIAVFIVAVLVIYSMIGTIIGTIEYYLSQQRLKQYFALMKKLDKYTTEYKENIGEELVSDYGGHINYKRKHH